MVNEKPTILVVDDASDVLTILKMGLERAGYQVHGFSDPVEALTHIEGGCHECEVLVRDVRMPNITGFQLVRRIKELRPEMKVVIMTAFEVNVSELKIVLPSLQVDNLILKPFAPSKLVEIITPLMPITKEA